METVLHGILTAGVQNSFFRGNEMVKKVCTYQRSLAGKI